MITGISTHSSFDAIKNILNNTYGFSISQNTNSCADKKTLRRQFKIKVSDYLKSDKVFKTHNLKDEVIAYINTKNF